MKQLPPIYSHYDEELSMRDSIESFVIGLAQRVDALQDAEFQGDLAAVRDHCKKLVSEADRTGYPALVELASVVVAACNGGQAEDVRKGLIDLTEIAQRVRKGSRGAA